MQNSVFLICALGVIGLSMVGILKVFKPTQWERTDGTLVESRVEKIPRSRMLERGPGSQTFDYNFILRYRYEVNGRIYEGSNYVYGLPNVTDSLADAENIVKEFAIGSHPTVYFDPTSPTQSCLFRPQKIPTARIVVLVVFLVITVALVAGGIWFFSNKT